MPEKTKRFLKNEVKIFKFKKIQSKFHKSYFRLFKKPSCSNVGKVIYKKDFTKLTFLLKNFYSNAQYEKLPNICNKQGQYKKTNKHIYLSRHVLLKHLRGGAGHKPVNFVKKKIW